MTRVTSNIGAIFGDIIVSTVDALAVGRGTGAEASGADALADEVHRASVDSSTVELIQPGSNSDSELAIEVGGGTEVLTFDVDFTVPEVTVNAGKAIIDRGEMDTAHPNISPTKTVSDAAAVVEINPQTLALDTSTLNHIFLDAGVSNDDSGAVVTNTTGSKPTTASLKIGEVDTSLNSVSEGWNRIADDGTLTYPDSDAASDASSRLQEGTIVYERASDTHFFVN